MGSKCKQKVSPFFLASFFAFFDRVFGFPIFLHFCCFDFWKLTCYFVLTVLPEDFSPKSARWPPLFILTLSCVEKRHSCQFYEQIDNLLVKSWNVQSSKLDVFFFSSKINWNSKQFDWFMSIENVEKRKVWFFSWWGIAMRLTLVLSLTFQFVTSLASGKKNDVVGKLLVFEQQWPVCENVKDCPFKSK